MEASVLHADCTKAEDDCDQWWPHAWSSLHQDTELKTGGNSTTAMVVEQLEDISRHGSYMNSRVQPSCEGLNLYFHGSLGQVGN